VFAVGEAIARNLKDRKTIVVKSTVPVGTNAELARRMAAITQVPFDTASNPEFLKEGAAIDDFTKPDRVVVGVRRTEVADQLRELHAPFLRTERPFLVMSPESSEMTKYVANGMLATKISFINEMANLCEAYGADIDDVRRGIGHDQRIGFSFLFPGAGYGGSCFPKDVRAIVNMAELKGLTPTLMRSVDDVNEAQKQVLPRKVLGHLGPDAQGKTVAIWGLAFKPRTDDIREAPALVLIDALLAAGCKVRVHDPEAMENVRKSSYESRGVVFAEHMYAALHDADALVIVTEWNEFRSPDFDTMKRLMRAPVIFDGRNLYDPRRMKATGFAYEGIGRAAR
jgi:UDPglucose 6-dehydrogenase